MPKLSIDEVRAWTEVVGAGQEFHYTKALEGQVDPLSYGSLRKIMSDLVKEGRLKHAGSRGFYRILEKVKPIVGFSNNPNQYFPLKFPYSHDDYSEFGFEELLDVSPGDIILLGGDTNSGKSCFALNLLGENLEVYECIVMGNEYVNADRTLKSKFERRMKRMTWANWLDEEGHFRFELLPVYEDFESYIKKDKLNIIDYIALEDNFWDIANVIKRIKFNLGEGITIIVLQKPAGRDLPRGGIFPVEVSDIYIAMDFYGDHKDESIVSFGKVKEPKGKVYSRWWAFKIVDGGANLHNIREVVKCRVCWGKGWKKSGNTSIPCDNCFKTGYVDK